MNALWSWASRDRMAGSKPTVRRRFRSQYPASMPVVSSQSPVTVEKNGVVAGRGAIGASTSSSSSLRSSTWAECDA